MTTRTTDKTRAALVATLRATIQDQKKLVATLRQIIRSKKKQITYLDGEVGRLKEALWTAQGQLLAAAHVKVAALWPKPRKVRP